MKGWLQYFAKKLNAGLGLPKRSQHFTLAKRRIELEFQESTRPKLVFLCTCTGKENSPFGIQLKYGISNIC